MRLIDADEFFRNYPELAIEPYINAPTVHHPNCDICEDKAKQYSSGFLDGYMTGKTRPQGEWLLVGHNDTVNFYKCSICGYEEHDNFTKHYYFCPNCGADMRGDRKETTFGNYLKEQLKDPEFKKEFEKLCDEDMKGGAE